MRQPRKAPTTDRLDLRVAVIADGERTLAYDAFWRRLLGIPAPFSPPPGRRHPGRALHQTRWEVA